MIRRAIGKIIFMLLRAAGKCLAAYLLERMIIMLTVNDANGKKVSLWGAIGQIALACACSYGMTKMSDETTSWVPFRNQMVANMAGTAFNFLGQQMQQQAVTQQGTAEQQTTETAAQ